MKMDVAAGWWWCRYCGYCEMSGHRRRLLVPELEVQNSCLKMSTPLQEVYLPWHINKNAANDTSTL